MFRKFLHTPQDYKYVFIYIVKYFYCLISLPTLIIFFVNDVHCGGRQGSGMDLTVLFLNGLI